MSYVSTVLHGGISVVFAFAAIAPSTHAQVSAAQNACAEIVSGLAGIRPQPSLVASGSGGRTWKEMYDECDRRDVFSDRALPTYRGRPLRCSSDPNRVARLVKYPDGTIVFTAKMAVDADGSPVIGGSGWPNNVETWLEFDTGSNDHYVNAEAVPFVVVPIPVPGNGPSFQRDTGIGKGDLAVAISNGRCSFGVVGDEGPWHRLGEASLRTHEELGNPQCVEAGQVPCQRLRGGHGVSIGSGVTYVIFPGTRPTPLWSQTVNEVAGRLSSEKALAFVRSNQAQP